MCDVIDAAVFCYPIPIQQPIRFRVCLYVLCIHQSVSMINYNAIFDIYEMMDNIYEFHKEKMMCAQMVFSGTELFAEITRTLHTLIERPNKPANERNKMNALECIRIDVRGINKQSIQFLHSIELFFFSVFASYISHSIFKFQFMLQKSDQLP